MRRFTEQAVTDRNYRRGAVLGLTIAETFILIAFALLMLLLLWRRESEAKIADVEVFISLPEKDKAAVLGMIEDGGLGWVQVIKEAGLGPAPADEAVVEWLRLRDDRDLRRIIEAVAIWKGEERQRLVELVALEPDEQSLSDLLALMESGTTPDEIREALALADQMTAAEGEAATEWLALGDDPELRQLTQAVAAWDGEKRQQLADLVALDPDVRSLSGLSELMQGGRTPEEIGAALALADEMAEEEAAADTLTELIRTQLATAAEREATLREATRETLGPAVARAGGEIDATGAIVLPDALLFARGRSDITEHLREFLADACQPWFETLRSIGFEVAEIRIEGHASSEWGDGGTPPEEAYFLNLALSQARAGNVLGECLRVAGDTEAGRWARQRATAAGLSSSHLILDGEGDEDAGRSRRVVFRASATTDDIMAGIGAELEAERPPDGMIRGDATVIDGDTVSVSDERIRLVAIDAPEGGQTCQRADGREWGCGAAASAALRNLIEGQPVACEPEGRDIYRRILAVCRLDDLDVNGWLVQEGHAVAYRDSSDYLHQEGLARQARRGVWQGAFQMPWDWRSRRASAAN